MNIRILQIQSKAKAFVKELTTNKGWAMTYPTELQEFLDTITQEEYTDVFLPILNAKLILREDMKTWEAR